MPEESPWYIPGMSDDSSKPLWPWIVVLLVGLPVLYVASFGPACWWVAKENRWPSHWGGITLKHKVEEYRRVPLVYWPIGCFIEHGPRRIVDALLCYSVLFGSPRLGYPTSWDGDVIFASRP